MLYNRRSIRDMLAALKTSPQHVVSAMHPTTPLRIHAYSLSLAYNYASIAVEAPVTRPSQPA